MCAEVGNKLPVRQVSDPRRDVRHLVVLSWDASYGGVDVLPPIHQGQLPLDWPGVGGYDDTTSVAAEVPPLAPGVGVFLEDVCGETLGDCLLCSMLVRFHLHADSRGSRRQGLLCGKCVRKWERNFRSGR